MCILVRYCRTWVLHETVGMWWGVKSLVGNKPCVIAGRQTCCIGCAGLLHCAYIYIFQSDVYLV